MFSINKDAEKIIILSYLYLKMNTTYLILGGNKGDKLNSLQNAIQLLAEQVGTVIKRSDVYATKAWGNTDQPDFVNQAICIQTSLSATHLLKSILSIEQQLGRVRDAQKWMERTIDIDILFYNDEIINTPDLKIPHPFIQERKFVLIPMAQLSPHFIHPVFNKSIETLLHECSDKLEVEKMPA